MKVLSLGDLLAAKAHWRIRVATGTIGFLIWTLSTVAQQTPGVGAISQSSLDGPSAANLPVLVAPQAQPVIRPSFFLSAGANPTSARIIVKLRDSAAQSLTSAMPADSNTLNMATAPSIERNLAALLNKHAVRTVTPLFAERARTRQGGDAMSKIKGVMRQRFPVRQARAPANEEMPDFSSTYLLDLDGRTPADVADTIESLRADPAVIYAEEDRIFHVSYVPNDPSYSSTGSWGQAYDDLYGLKKINTTQAWDTTQGQGVVVAVVDTGIDYNHPDISANVWINTAEIPGNGIDDDHNGFIDDVRGWDFVGHSMSVLAPDNDPFDGYFHGTHVAGTIAAVGNNNLGVVGVAWKAKVMAVKALDDNGSGPESSLAKAIVYAVDNGADIINASWGGEGQSQTISDAVAYAHAAGVVFVAAAGNSTADAKNFNPACLPEVIAVSSVGSTNLLSYFSNFGSKIDVAAPGEDILSLQAGATGYTRLNGTSMATPHVSGTAALILAQHPDFSNEQVRQALRVSAFDLGDAGKDTSFGYGLINAAQAVLVSHPLTVKIFSPIEGDEPISNPITVIGSANGAGFSHYILDYGAGMAPSSWTTLRDSTTTVFNGDLGTFDPSIVPDDIYTVRLRAFGAAGAVFSDQIQIQVRYVQIAFPALPYAPSLAQMVKPGEELQLVGQVTGPGFKSYKLEWAPGQAAVSGWSTVGMTLSSPGFGSSPVADGALGTWSVPATCSAGYYTIRLTMVDTGFSRTVMTLVYVEPSLISAVWPQFGDSVWYQTSALPVRQSDGSTRLTVESSINAMAAFLYSYAPSGAAKTVPLSYGSYFQPAVGNIDGKLGDEIVASDIINLRIFTPDLAPLTTIPAPPHRAFGYDQVVLADLDNDGVPEILAPARDDDSSSGSRNFLYAYRANGALFSKNYPLSFLSGTGILDNLKVIAVDLNGDGRKEIVVGAVRDPMAYTVDVFNADGSAYPGWTPQKFPGCNILSMAATDLDHDGTVEIVVGEYDQNSSSYQIRVLNNTGAVRPGWPVAQNGPPNFAIGDLTRNHKNEIIVSANTTLSVWRDDGTRLVPSWPIGASDGYTASTSPVIADIDGDGVPEIIVATADVFFGPYPFFYHYSTLTSYRRDGSFHRSWPLLGMLDEQPFIGTPLVGDFNEDGNTDLVVNISLILGAGKIGQLRDTALTYLTAGTPFNPAASDWTGNFHDGQNSRVLNADYVAPLIAVQPQARFAASGSMVILSVTASGAPAMTYQWYKNGVSIPGATSSTLTLSKVQAADAGSYSVIVSNTAGAISSKRVSLTVRTSLENDFSADGKADLLWQNRVTGERLLWLMNGTSVTGGVGLGTVPIEWDISATGDFDSDGGTDLVWTNTATGERTIWLMNGTTVVGAAGLGTVSTDWVVAATGDFNHDGKSDLVWQNTVTGERTLWLMNGTSRTSEIGLGTISTDWCIAGTGDFNGDGQTDIYWQNTVTGQHLVWYMNGTSVSSGAGLGAYAQYSVAGFGDYNADGKSDLLMTNNATGERSIWLLNGTTVTNTVALTTLSLEWVLNRPIPRRTYSDFNRDGKTDIIWQNAITGERLIWLMNGTNVASDVSLATIPVEWKIATTGDFNNDGKSDIVWQNTSTGERTIWLMNGATVSSGAGLGVTPLAWTIGASGDFNADGKSDLVLQNTSTNEVVIWLMDGTTKTSTASLGVQASWRTATAGDFNNDGKSDIVWRNPTTGEHKIWLMNGTVKSSEVSLGTFGSEWSITGSGDFNQDGKSDLLWQNSLTGERLLWLMNGTTVSTGFGLGAFPVEWSSRN